MWSVGAAELALVLISFFTDSDDLLWSSVCYKQINLVADDLQMELIENVKTSILKTL